MLWRETGLRRKTLDIVLKIEYKYPMKHEQRTIKVWTDTYRNLRILAAYTGEKIVTLLNRLITEELNKVNKSNDKNQSL